MKLPARIPSRPLAFIALAVVLMVAMTAPHSDDPAPRSIDLDAFRTALASVPTGDIPLTDDLDFFEARLHASPGDPLALRRISSISQLRFRAYNDQVELDRAEQVLEALTVRYPKDASVHGMVGSLALARHDFQTALTSARARAANTAQGDEGARLGLFDARWATGDYDGARHLLEDSRGTRSSQGRLSREARLLDALGRVGDARDLMKRVVELGDAYNQPAVVRAWGRVELGTFTLHAGDSRRAVDLYLEALALVPGYPAALEGLGLVAWGVDRDPIIAEELLRRSVTFGSHLDLYPVLAEIATTRGATVRAREYADAFERLATANPIEERMYWRPLAIVMADRPRQREQALGYAEADLAQRQDRGAWATRGWVLHRMGRHDEAVADMDRALAWGTPAPAVFSLAGQVYLAAGQRSQGREALRQALSGRAELGPVTARKLENLLDASD